jgi:HDOD domain
MAGSFKSAHAGNQHKVPGCVRAIDGDWNTRCQPRLTALPATLVQMELLLSDPVVDLCTLAEVVTKDTVLAGQLLRMSNIDRRYEERFLRVEDCLVDLGIDWLLAVVRDVPLSSQRNA